MYLLRGRRVVSIVPGVKAIRSRLIRRLAVKETQAEVLVWSHSCASSVSDVLIDSIHYCRTQSKDTMNFLTRSRHLCSYLLFLDEIDGYEIRSW